MGLRSYLEWKLWADGEVVRRVKAEIGEDAYYAELAREGAQVIAYIVGFFVVLFLYGPVVGFVSPWVAGG